MNGLALSGGGFRATLFHLGVIRYLYEKGQLKNITHISSVSGGSILAAHLVLNWERYTGDELEFEDAASELIKFIKMDVRGRIVRRAPFYLPFRLLNNALPPSILKNGLLPKSVFKLFKNLNKSTTGLLEKYYSKYLFRQLTLKSLKRTNRPKLYLLSTKYGQGDYCAFTGDGFSVDGLSKETPASTLSLGRAVAASSAFPGIFPPVLITEENSGIKTRSLGGTELYLVDGGVFENLGVGIFQRLIREKREKFTNVIISDASAEFKKVDKGGIFDPLTDPITTPLRAADILFNTVNQMARDSALKSYRNIFKLIRLSTLVEEDEKKPFNLDQSHQSELFSVRTDLDAFSDLEIFCLIKHGYSVASSILCDSTKSVNVETQPSGNWNPLPKNRDPFVKSLGNNKGIVQGNISEDIRQLLDESAKRPLGLFSRKDLISYAHVLIAIALISFVIFGPGGWEKISKIYSDPIEDVKKRNEIEGQIKQLQENYFNSIVNRSVEFTETDGKKVRGFLSSPPRLKDSNISLPVSKDSTPLETWNTSQATYALLKSSSRYELFNRELKKFLISAIDHRFVKVSNSNHSDWVPEKKGWFTRPGQKLLQAEPALWTVAAIAVLSRKIELDQQTKTRMQDYLNGIQSYLVKNKFYSNQSSDGIAFNMFATQKDLNEVSPYTTALALLAFIELKKTGLTFGTENIEELIKSLTKFLENRYFTHAPYGWRGVETPPALNEISEAFTLQTLSTLVEAYKEMGRSYNEIPDTIKKGISLQLLGLIDRQLLKRLSPVDNSVGRTYLLAEDYKREISMHEISITFLWRPWAIRLCRQLLLFGENDLSISEKLEFRDILFKFIVDEGNEIKAKNENDFTFVSSEMLIGLGEI